MADLYSILATRNLLVSVTGLGTVTESVESSDSDRSSVDRLTVTLPVS